MAKKPIAVDDRGSQIKHLDRDACKSGSMLPTGDAGAYDERGKRSIVRRIIQRSVKVGQSGRRGKADRAMEDVADALDPIRLWSSSHRKVDRIALVAHVVKWPKPDRARLGVRPVSG